jgi:hypothetical protein
LNTKEQFETGEISERKRGTLLKGLPGNIERPLRLGGRRPQPLHGQPDAVLSGATSQKLVFFASFYKILIKGGFMV